MVIPRRAGTALVSGRWFCTLGLPVQGHQLTAANGEWYGGARNDGKRSGDLGPYGEGGHSGARRNTRLKVDLDSRSPPGRAVGLRHRLWCAPLPWSCRGRGRDEVTTVADLFLTRPGVRRRRHRGAVRRDESSEGTDDESKEPTDGSTESTDDVMDEVTDEDSNEGDDESRGRRRGGPAGTGCL